MKGKEMFTEEEIEAAWEETRGISSWARWAGVPEEGRRRYRAFANALPTKREGEPIDREDIRVGDLIRGTIASSLQGHAHLNGGIVEARAHRPGMGGLCVTDWSIEALDDLRLIDRPVPKLKAGQVIRVDETGVYGKHLIGREVFVHSTDIAVSNAGTIVVVDIQDDKSERIHRDLITAFTVLWPTEESK